MKFDKMMFRCQQGATEADIGEAIAFYKTDEIYQHIPTRFLASILRYTKEYIEPGGFVYAMLTNDLKETVARADADAYHAMKNLLTFIYMEAPATCWGSTQKVEQWLAYGKELRDGTRAGHDEDAGSKTSGSPGEGVRHGSDSPDTGGAQTADRPTDPDDERSHGIGIAYDQD